MGGILAKLFGGSVIDGVSKLISQFHLSPEKQAEMQKALLDNAQEVERWAHEAEMKAMDNEVRALETVNQTMREEAKSEHFLQWAWRPIVGFTMSAVMVNNYILLPYFRKFGLLPIEIPGEVWNVMLVVLGIAAGTRGYQKIVEAKK
jgi:hypothetical protein